jgi:hypothetical protein
MMSKGSQPRPDRAALLNKAVSCYWQANCNDDACRCLEKLGDFGGAAPLHERAGRWDRAAWCFEQAGHWPAAARCYRQANEPLEAVRCLINASELLEAGWLLAHEAHRGDHARAILAQVNPQTTEEQLALALAKARCMVGSERHAAGNVVRRVADGLAQTAPGPGRERVMQWALTLAEVLDRPDLTAQLHATAVDTAIPQAAERWEQWALERLGNASGIDIEH